MALTKPSQPYEVPSEEPTPYIEPREIPAKPEPAKAPATAPAEPVPA